MSTVGAAVDLATCVVPQGELPVVATSAGATYVGHQIYDGRIDVPSCVRVTFNDNSWFRAAIDAGSPQWQVTLYVLEALAAGPVITVRPLRARGAAVNISPGNVTVGVTVSWVGGGLPPAPGSPLYPRGLVQVTVSDLRAQWSVQQAGAQYPGATNVLGPFVYDPDMIYENGTFVGRRFAEALRVHWRVGQLAPPGPFALFTYEFVSGSGAPLVFNCGNWPLDPHGSTDITLDGGVAITKAVSEVSVSCEWVVYG